MGRLGDIPGAGCGRPASLSPWTGTAGGPRHSGRPRRRSWLLPESLGHGWFLRQGLAGQVCSLLAPGLDPATSFVRRFRSQRAAAMGRWRLPQPSCAGGLAQEVGLPERGTVQTRSVTHGDEGTMGIPEGPEPPGPHTHLSPRRILLSLCLSRYWLPPVPGRQPEPSSGHQDAPAAVPGGRGPAR